MRTTKPTSESGQLFTEMMKNLERSGSEQVFNQQKTLLERLLSDWHQAYSMIAAQLQSACAQIEELAQQNMTILNLNAQLLQRAHSAETRIVAAEIKYIQESAALQAAQEELARLKAESAHASTDNLSDVLNQMHGA